MKVSLMPVFAVFAFSIHFKLGLSQAEHIFCLKACLHCCPPRGAHSVNYKKGKRLAPARIKPTTSWLWGGVLYHCAKSATPMNKSYQESERKHGNAGTEGVWEVVEQHQPVPQRRRAHLLQQVVLQRNLVKKLWNLAIGWVASCIREPWQAQKQMLWPLSFNNPKFTAIYDLISTNHIIPLDEFFLQSRNHNLTVFRHLGNQTAVWLKSNDDVATCFEKFALTCEGSLLVATGLLVDQANVWAEPQATRLIFLPCKAATSLGLWMALVLPSPSWPSSLSPQVYTSP